MVLQCSTFSSHKHDPNCNDMFTDCLMNELIKGIMTYLKENLDGKKNIYCIRITKGGLPANIKILCCTCLKLKWLRTLSKKCFMNFDGWQNIILYFCCKAGKSGQINSLRQTQYFRLFVSVANCFLCSYANCNICCKVKDIAVVISITSRSN